MAVRYTSKTKRAQERGEGATPEQLMQMQERLAQTSPEYKKLGKDIIKGATTPVMFALKALDFGADPIQRAVFGKTVDEFEDTPGKIDNVARFALDTVMTPSTYVGGVGLVAGAGRKAAVRGIGGEAVEHLTKQGVTREAAEKQVSELTKGVARKGADPTDDLMTSATYSTVRQRMAKELPDFEPSAMAGGGIGLRNPLTGKPFGKPIVSGQTTSKALAGPSQAIANFAPIRGVLNIPQSRIARKGGYQSMIAHDAKKIHQVRAGNDIAKWGGALEQVSKAFGRNNDDVDRFLQVLTGQEDAIRPGAVTPKQWDAVEAYRSATAEAHEALASRGVDIGMVDDYFTLQWSQEARRAAGRGVPTMFSQAGMRQHSRQIPDLEGLTIRQRNEKIKELGLFPGFEGDLYDESALKTMHNYFSATAHKAHSVDYENWLTEKGMSRSTLREMKSGIDPDIGRRAGFENHQEMMEMAARNPADPRLARVAEIDPEQAQKVQAVTAQNLREIQLDTQTSGVRAVLGKRGIDWTSHKTLLNPKTSPLLNQRYTVVSAANSADDNLNEAAHTALLAELKRDGYVPIEAVGSTPEMGREIPSLLVPEMSPRAAQSLMARHGLPTVATERGILHNDGTIDVFDQIRVGKDADPDKGFVTFAAGDTPVQFQQIPSGNRIPLEDLPPVLTAKGRVKTWQPAGIAKLGQKVAKREEALMEFRSSLLNKQNLNQSAASKVNAAQRVRSEIDNLPQASQRQEYRRFAQRLEGEARTLRSEAADIPANETKAKTLEASVRAATREFQKKKSLADNYLAGLDPKGEAIPMPKELPIDGAGLATAKAEWENVSGSILPALNGRFYPRYLAQELSNTLQPGKFDNFYKGLENFWRVWRRSVTGPFPAFHMRNMIGGYFNNYIGGVQTRHYADFERMLRGQVDMDFRWKRYVNNETGQPMSTREILDAMADHNIATPASIRQTQLGQHGLGDQFGLRGGVTGAAKRGEEALAKGTGRASTAIENRLRGPAFLKGIEEYKDLSHAADFMFVRHGDYANLSPTEQRLRLAMPFYVWSKTNIPFQINNLVANPGKYAKYQNLMEALGADPGEGTFADPASTMVAERGGIRSPFDPTRMIFPDLPLYDLNDLAPSEIASGFLGRYPIAGGLAEAATGRSVVSGRELRFRAPGVLERPLAEALSRIPGMDESFRTGPGGELLISERLTSLLGIGNPTDRVGGTIDRLLGTGAYAKRDEPVGERFASLLVGTYEADPQRARNTAAMKQRDLLSELYDVGYGDIFAETKE